VFQIELLIATFAAPHNLGGDLPEAAIDPSRATKPSRLGREQPYDWLPTAMATGSL
jgi:hypothetical protein